MSARRSSRRIHTGRVLNLDIDTVRFPDGSTGELEMIRHPGASAVIPVLGDVTDPDPEILLIKQYRYAAERFLYEIPAGRLEPNEEPIVCAHRELAEETGYTASTVEHLYTMFTTPGFTDEQIHVFVARGLTVGTHAREPDEFMTVEPMRLTQAIDLVKRGEIMDAKTALALLRFSLDRVGGR
jgi:ADP-ribose pyrophosphatase